MNKFLFIICMFLGMLAGSPADAQQLREVSGVYPSLAFFNQEGECGTGAVVPWAGNLWVISYGPHKAFGSSDKLYKISPDLQLSVCPESIGGTHACRMIHRESNQLFMGPYVIDYAGNVRVIGFDRMPGRLTGFARSLTDPADKVCVATMEQGFYEVDARFLDVETWFKDGNQLQQEGAASYQRTLCKGVHGKGYYSGQGVYVYSNNGEDVPEALTNPRIEAGSLSEYDGETWKTVRRNQFTEVTGPGGIYGARHPETDPIWSLGWDWKSVILAVRDADSGWAFFRLPKASNSYDGAHGWNTEWPRIRKTGDRYLMTMHGMFWDFPETFSWAHHAGLRPLTSYLKVIGDFCLWNDRLVFGCDDSAQSEFLNKRKVKGKILGPGQSQSNLWFTSRDLPAHNGTSDAIGAVWESEKVAANEVSEPFLLAGWKRRRMWIDNQSDEDVGYTLEIDKNGDNRWERNAVIRVPAHSQKETNISHLEGEWIRISVDKPTETTVAFVYGDVRRRSSANHRIFHGMASTEETSVCGGLLYSLGNDERKLGVLAQKRDRNGMTETGYYELDDELVLSKVDNPKMASQIREKMAIPQQAVQSDKGSYLIVDDSGRRWRLPKNEKQYDDLVEACALRICREVATERDLFNLGGTFYELPAENADGFAKIRPICTHHLQIGDYASYRGMLVLTGIKEKKKADRHVIVSADGLCKVWCGAIDDLWKMGKPVGIGGPWVDAVVEADNPSDPYLIGHYDQKRISLSHQSQTSVVFTIEMDPTGDGTWMKYADVVVPPQRTYEMNLPKGHIARWIRFRTDKNTIATTWLTYR